MIPFTEAAIRLALALAFGAVIGVEREWRMKQAGLKTMALVALGAAAFAMVSDTFGPGNHSPGQIAAAVVGGIGFLGAGVIMHRGLTVQGLTTAATLWAVASVGVVSGLGHTSLAVALTAAIVFTQIAGRSIEVRIRSARRSKQTSRVELRIDCENGSLDNVNRLWQSHAPGEVLRTSMQRRADAFEVRAVLRAPSSTDFTPLTEALVHAPGVKRVDLRHLGLDDE